MGLVGLEAMACGLSCVISDAGGPMSYAQDGKNALVFDKNSAEDLEDKILQFYNMDLERNHLIRDAAYGTAQMYSSEIVRNQILSIFGRLEKYKSNE